MGLQHVAVTAVTRDDLPDGSAKQLADTILDLRDARPGSGVIRLTTPQDQCFS